MSGQEKKIENINNYLYKLQSFINKNSSFTIFGFKFVKKKNIDDIFCCIEGAFPEEYKNAIKKLGKKKLKGYSIYLELLNSFKKYKSISSAHYIIKYESVLTQVSLLAKIMVSDFKMVFKEEDNKF